AVYEGVVDENLNITKFLGIRYAAPPTGNLRSTTPSKLDGIQQADANPDQCYQGMFGASPTNPLSPRDDTPAQSEDCLFLRSASIPYPHGEIEQLPQLFFVQRNPHTFGSASLYNGSDLVQESNGEAVVVAWNSFMDIPIRPGFLAGQQVKDDGVLNAGLLDQDFVLRWVNTNVYLQRGDPDQVTIWGESAGAGSVIQHMVVNDGNTEPQLFWAGITSSTLLPSQYLYNHTIPQILFNEVVLQAGYVSHSNCTWSLISVSSCNVTDILDCLRSVDGPSLQDINLSMILGGFFGTFTFVPVVDGSFITRSPTEAFAHGKLNGVCYSTTPQVSFHQRTSTSGYLNLDPNRPHPFKSSCGLRGPPRVGMNHLMGTRTHHGHAHHGYTHLSWACPPWVYPCVISQLGGHANFLA
ncbi:Alpha/Beta hydrolase protein, partial [Mycena maculata]